jgi:hypothetical protein
VAKLEDIAIAVCDYRTLDIDDLRATDRIYVSLKTQVYFLKYNAGQRWCWFSNQTSNELMLMLMYDTKPREEHANCELYFHMKSPSELVVEPKSGKHSVLMSLSAMPWLGRSLISGRVSRRGTLSWL